MLCERCQSNEATVHFSVVAWPACDVTNHFCETCYPKHEAERTASYGAGLTDAYRAARKERDFNRERLATELLEKAFHSLEKGDDAWEMVGFGIGSTSSLPDVRIAALVPLLEKIFLRSVELMAQSSTPPSDHPFGVGLTIAGHALRRADPARYSAMIETLKAQHRGSSAALAVLDYVERRESEKWGRKKRGHDV